MKSLKSIYFDKAVLDNICFLPNFFHKANKNKTGNNLIKGNGKPITSLAIVHTIDAVIVKYDINQSLFNTEDRIEFNISFFDGEHGLNVNIKNGFKSLTYESYETECSLMSSEFVEAHILDDIFSAEQINLFLLIHKKAFKFIPETGFGGTHAWFATSVTSCSHLPQYHGELSFE